MDANDVFKAVQDLMRDPPLFLIGTGGSIPYGLPGMAKLATHLETVLTPKYNGNPAWAAFLERLADGKDLETALTDLFLSEEIRNDIITSNYDRVIEYACDFAGLPLDIRFAGIYYKQMSTLPIAQRKSVNLLKVHGSLDLFQDINQQVISLPLRREIPCGFIPSIITPGSEKYRTILRDPMRQTLYDAITLMEQASSYLCIGYGFNDEQIQANIIKGIRCGKPILVVTQKISESAASLLVNNGKRFITLTEGGAHNTTEVVIDRKTCEIEGNYWSISGLLSILEGK